MHTHGGQGSHLVELEMARHFPCDVGRHDLIASPKKQNLRMQHVMKKAGRVGSSGCCLVLKIKAMIVHSRQCHSKRTCILVSSGAGPAIFRPCNTFARDRPASSDTFRVCACCHDLRNPCETWPWSCPVQGLGKILFVGALLPLHSMSVNGLSCGAVLLDSTSCIHTWPEVPALAICGVST